MTYTTEMDHCDTRNCSGSSQPRPTPDKGNPSISAGSPSLSSSNKPSETFFIDAIWSSGKYLDSSDSSSGDNLSFNMIPTYLPSERSYSTVDDSSVVTPTSTEEPSIDQLDGQTSVQVGEDHHDDRDPLAIPHYDKDQALPRPQTLHIPNRDIKKSPARRPRALKDVNKVNQVRDNGACIKCRVQKVSCTIDDICDHCKKAYPQYHQTPEVCCIRQDLATVAKQYSSKRFDGMNRKEDHGVNEALRRASPRFHDGLITGHVLFDQDRSQPGIGAFLRNYTCSPDGRNVVHRGCTFAKDRISPALMEEELLQWAEQVSSPVGDDTFEGAIESFVKVCSKSSSLGNVRDEVGPLLRNVHMLKSMYKLCRARTFYFAQLQSNGGQTTQALPQLPIPAQVELRGVARAAFESAEKKVLAGLDKYLKGAKLNDRQRPLIWAAMWQIMLIYRDLLRNAKPSRGNAESLLNAVAVFYAAWFRTLGSLRLSMDGEVAGAFVYVMSLRDTFYQSIVAGVAAVDQRLKDLVVGPEMKILGRRQTKKSARGQDGDVVMGGC